GDAGGAFPTAVVIGHYQAPRRDKRRRTDRQTDRRESHVIEPFLIRRETVRATPIVEWWRVERPHRAELRPVGGRRKLSPIRLPGGNTLTESLPRGSERGGECQRAEHGSTRQHFRSSCS